MALDSTGLFTVIGKYVKAVNTWNGYIATLETLKDEIFDKLEDEALQDLYVNLPSQFLGFKNAVGSWINALNGEVEDILLDEEYVTDELPIFQRDVTSVLNAIYDYMIDNVITVKSSVVTLAGNDVDKRVFQLSPAHVAMNFYVSRTLDGVSAPSSNISAHTRYAGAESQLAMSCTTQVRCIANTIGSENFQLFCEVDEQTPYGPYPEKPGNGPNLVNARSLNVVPLNHDFSLFSGDTPNSWTMAGGVQTTDWAKWTTNFPNGLEMKTAGVTVKQQLTGLTRYQNYFFAVAFHIGAVDIGLGDLDSTVIVTVEDVAGSAYATSGSLVIPNIASISLDGNYYDSMKIAYGFFCPEAVDDMNNFYLKIEADAFEDTDLSVVACQAVVAPVTYYNGLGFTAYSPTDMEVPINSVGSIAIANSNAGVFQTYFRRAFNIQLPTADSPTVSDTLAT